MLTLPEVIEKLSKSSDPYVAELRGLLEGFDPPAAEDWAKARAFEDMMGLAVQMILRTDRSPMLDAIRIAALSFVKIGRKGVEDPIANEPTQEPS